LFGALTLHKTVAHQLHTSVSRLDEEVSHLADGENMVL